MVDRSLQRLIGFDCRSLFDALSYFYPTFWTLQLYSWPSSLCTTQLPTRKLSFFPRHYFV
jgi:hypothetical protein